MKLIRFGEFRKEKPGILTDNGIRRDCSTFFDDWNYDFFQNGGLDKLAVINIDQFPIVDENIRWGACITRPGKVVCIGLNYRDHVAETGMKMPNEPAIFMKGTNTVVGPYDNILIPKNSKKTDWEIELGVIIKKDCRYLNSEKDASDYIAGYTISNDVSEREFQIERGGQWTKGKSCDTFNPVGPFLATPDELKNINDLKMKLSVNGSVRQNGNTGNMVFDPHYIVNYLSQFMTLEAGDLISTGTPCGVGMGMHPQQFLKDGDIVELKIDGLGKQRQICKKTDAR